MMKNRTYIAIGVLAFVLLILVIWRREGNAPEHPKPPVFGETNSSIISPVVSAVRKEHDASDFPEGENTRSTNTKLERYVAKASDLGYSMNRPVRFYGQIIDQNNQPVGGVGIKCNLSYFREVALPGLMPANKQIDRVTDDSGRFSVVGEIGLALDVTILPRNDYIFKPDFKQVMLRDEGINTPAPKISTADNPYRFNAFKKGGSADSIKGAFVFYDCIPDGRFYTVKFVNKKIVEGATGGDLRISVRRPVGGYSQKDYDWSVKIDSADMVLMESHDVFMYQAPEAGYEHSWSFVRQASRSDYTREVSSKFYLKSLDGSTYGRFEIRIISDYREASGLIINYCLNPTGSRNLE